MKIRINKYLSNIGYCSRREADRYISKGLVAINGSLAELGSLVDDTDKITVDNKEVCISIKKIYLKFYKPRGIVCTTAKFDKNNIVDYINYSERIYPIGRLDKDSEGLILLTNDGSIVNPILKSSNNHEKEYIVELNKEVDSKILNRLEKGVPILGVITKPCKIIKLNKNSVKIIITQGLNRQIRRMFEYVGFKVIKLKRIRILNIKLDGIKEGEYKELTKKELLDLKKGIKYNG